MTRGWFVITKGKTIIKAGYSNSDSYEEGRGIEFFDAIVENRAEEYIDSLEPVEDFTMELILKGEDFGNGNYFQFDYGYVYNVNTKKLKVYNFCKPIYSINMTDLNEIEKYRFVFENSSTLWPVISYNPDTFDYDYDEKKYKKTIADSIPEVLHQFVELYDSPRIELSNDHFVANGHRPGHEVYIKTLKVSNSPDRLEFIAEHESYLSRDYGWELLIQAPYARIHVSNVSYRSEKKLVEAIRAMINSKGIDKFMRLAHIFAMYQDARDKNVLDKFADALDKEWETEPWYVNKGLSCDDIKREARSSFRHSQQIEEVIA